MLQGLKSKKRHLILLSDVLNISNKSLTMALALSLSLYSGRRRKKLCGKNSVQQAMTMKFFFSKKPFSSLGFYYTHVLIKVIHSRRIKELLSLFFAHFLSFCSHFVSVARLFLHLEKVLDSLLPPTLLQVLSKSL